MTASTLSNFRLWQISYAEIWICDEAWPEFTVETLKAALEAYARRQRKFGNVVNTAPIPQEGHD